MQLYESPDVIVLHSYLWGWMNSKVYKRKLDAGDEFLARVLGAPACVKRGEDQLRRTTRGLHTRVAKWDFRKFVVNCNKSVISVGQICLLNMKLKLK